MSDNNKAFVYAKGSNKLLSLDGKTVQDLKEVIAKYKGKLVLFDFWASWCIPCREEMPHSSTLKKEYKDKYIVFVTISKTIYMITFFRSTETAEPSASITETGFSLFKNLKPSP